MALRFYAPYTRIPSFVADEIQLTLKELPLPITMVNAQNAGVVTLRALLQQRFIIEVNAQNQLISINESSPASGFVFFVHGVQYPGTSDINTVYVAPGNIVEVHGAI